MTDDDYDARAKLAAQKELFEKRVSKAAARLGLPIKSWSVAYISNLVRRDADAAAITDDVLAKRLEVLVPKERVHFDLAFDANRAGNNPTAKLEHARKVEAALTPKTPSQKLILTAKEKAWVAAHGADAALEIANRAANGEAPLFEGDSNE